MDLCRWLLDRLNKHLEGLEKKRRQGARAEAVLSEAGADLFNLLSAPLKLRGEIQSNTSDVTALRRSGITVLADRSTLHLWWQSAQPDEQFPWQEHDPDWNWTAAYWLVVNTYKDYLVWNFGAVPMTSVPPGEGHAS